MAGSSTVHSLPHIKQRCLLFTSYISHQERAPLFGNFFHIKPSQRFSALAHCIDIRMSAFAPLLMVDLTSVLGNR